ncbi:MAG: head completion/stabilization protein [Brevundimonas sp.]|uniref:head completion/stabilization protein n=1 Tax=Brevundimonas sp. TaxID=1871086 RepID=UPI00391A7805
MSGISFNPPNSDSQQPAAPPPADEVRLSDFWPAVNITAVREAVRLDPNITPGRLRDAVRLAMLDIAGELAPWRALQEAAGHAGLTDVPARIMVDDVSDYVMRFNRAVYSVVGADLGERQIGGGVTAAGADRADQLRLDVDIHLRNVRYAVRDFLGQPRARVALV